MLTFSDYCAGIGGFRIALEKFNLKCVHTCEINEDCIKTYNQNFADNCIPTNLLTLEEQNIPNQDILCSGFPCQPFSIAGSLKGFEDPRGTIIHKILDICKYKKPKVVFLENVKNFKSIQKGTAFNYTISQLKKLGYSVFYEILTSSDFGIPQKRSRVYIVAFREDLKINNFTFPQKQTEEPALRDFLEHGDNSIPITSRWGHYIDLYTNKTLPEDIPFEIPKTRKKLERADPFIDLNDCLFQMRSSGIRAISLDRSSPTLAVSVSGGGAMIPVLSKERRHLNLTEMKRIMGFPEDFKFPVSRTSAVKQLANAVCPPVIEAIMKNIIEKINNN